MAENNGQLRDALARAMNRQFSPQEVDRASQLAAGMKNLPKAVLDSLIHMVKTPGEMMKPNPNKPGTEAWDFYERSKQDAAGKWAPEMALNMIGAPALGGVSAGGKEAVLGSGGIKAYHSSPHDFDKFDLARIGTGEGAQAYGHGLYFAENPAVSGQGGQYWNQFLRRFEGTPEGNAAKRLRDAGFDREKAAADYEAFLRSKAVQPRPSSAAEASARRLYEAAMAKGNAELELLRSGQPVGPRTYEVSINADPKRMLDWDKPLAQQGMDLTSAGEMAFPAARGLRQFQPKVGELSGGDFYRALVQRAGNKPAASQLMQEAGIPGIRYLDEGSRAAGLNNVAQTEAAIIAVKDKIRGLDPARDRDLINFHMDNMARWEAEVAHAKANPLTSNYVVFDPNKIAIDKKYGIAAGLPTAGAAAAAAAASGNEDQM
jgi:hypothetical protein